VGEWAPPWHGASSATPPRGRRRFYGGGNGPARVCGCVPPSAAACGCACVGAAVWLLPASVCAAVTDQRVINLLTSGLVIFPSRGPINLGFSIASTYVLSLMSSYVYSRDTASGFPFIRAGCSLIGLLHTLALCCY
jgi:hypothetical protein